MKTLVKLILPIIILLPGPFAGAQVDGVAVLEEISGNVTVLRSGKPVSVAAGMDLTAEDIVKTGAGSVAVLRHSTGMRSEITQNSSLRVTDDIFSITGLILVHGTVVTEGNPNRDSQFRIGSTTAIIGVRGTKFTVSAAYDGNSVVSVDEGLVSLGLGQEILILTSGRHSKGSLTEGYGAPEEGTWTLEESEDWRSKQDEDIKSRAASVLEELARLQKEEDRDWKEIEQEVLQAQRRIMTGTMSDQDKYFFRRVFDIEDRMAARRLLAIELREVTGLTDPDEANSERERLQLEWEARNWRRAAWESALTGKMIQKPMPKNLQIQSQKAMKAFSAIPKTMPSTVSVLPDTADLFPSVVQGIYLGMSEQELQAMRPKAPPPPTPAVLGNQDLPVVYTETELSGDRTVPGWYTGMYTFYRGKLVQGAFMAFEDVADLRSATVREMNGRFGQPWRRRVEEDWAQPGVLKGSSMEWRDERLEVIFVSRVLPALQGRRRALELRIRLKGYDMILEPGSQLSEADPAQTGAQLAIDFPA